MAVSARRRLLRWGSWFAVGNGALMAVVGLRYLWYYFALGPSFAWIYVIIAYVGHFSALAYLVFLLMVPVIALIPRPRLVLPLGVFLASAGVSLLLLDTLVFAENRYHLGVLTASLLAPETWAFLSTSSWGWPSRPCWRAGSGSAPRSPRGLEGAGPSFWASQPASLPAISST